jgi:hypothetical protein
MANLVSYQAILFPFDDRMPHLVSLSTSAIDLSGMHMVSELFRSGRIPHPEVFMDYITEETRSQAWSLRVRLYVLKPSQAYKLYDLIGHRQPGWHVPEAHDAIYCVLCNGVSRRHAVPG